MGDEVVYFVQGHQMYVEAVKNKKIYTFNNRDVPWTKTKLRVRHNINFHQFLLNLKTYLLIFEKIG